MQNCTYTAQGFLACPNINVKKVNRTDKVYSEVFEHFTAAPTNVIQRVEPAPAAALSNYDPKTVPSPVLIKYPGAPTIVANNNIPERKYEIDDLSQQTKIPSNTTKTIPKNPSIKVTPEKPINPGA